MRRGSEKTPLTADRPTPAKRNADETRSRILRAAQTLFSKRGYASVGVREIASAAHADPTLIRRYFGSKEKLFEAALAGALDVSTLLSFGHENFGVEAVAFVISGEQNVINPLPMLLYSTADVTSRQIASRLLDDLVIKPIGDWLGPPDGDELAARITMLFSGMFLYWKLLPVGPLSGEVPESTRTWLSQSLQALVDRR